MTSDAWSVLGTPVTAATTATDAMTQTGLAGWDLTKTPLTTRVGRTDVPIPGRSAVVRGKTPLGIVGAGYQLVQNEEYAPLLDTLAEESGATFTTGGELDGGRRTFLTMRLPGHITIGGDRVENYVSAITSHDGSMAFTPMVTPVVAADGTLLNMTYAGHAPLLRIRHTRGTHQLLVAQARGALDFTFDYLEAFQTEADRLATAELGQATFEKMIAREFGAPSSAGKATITRADRRVHAIAERFADAIAAGAPQTRWTGLCAIAGWSDHLSPARGDDTDTSRALRAVLDPSFKNRALKLMTKGIR